MSQIATTIPTTNEPSPEQIHRAQWKAGVLGALNLLIAATSVRITLQIAIIGGIAITWATMSNPDPWKLGALAIYGGMVGAVVWLASRR